MTIGVILVIILGAIFALYYRRHRTPPKYAEAVGDNPPDAAAKHEPTRFVEAEGDQIFEKDAEDVVELPGHRFSTMAKDRPQEEAPVEAPASAYPRQSILQTPAVAYGRDEYEYGDEISPDRPSHNI